MKKGRTRQEPEEIIKTVITKEGTLMSLSWKKKIKQHAMQEILDKILAPLGLRTIPVLKIGKPR